MHGGLLLTAAALSQPRSYNESQLVTPIFDQCSEPGTSCASTNCCTRPGYACMQHREDLHKECRRTTGVCEDTPDWSCPSTEMCTTQFGDCRSTLCCQNVPNFRGRRDVPFQCVRRPTVYYAQCRPAPDEADEACVDSASWLCPGWERCAGAHEECTRSRCCADPGFSCYLNATALQVDGGWHAWCRPTEGVGGVEGTGCKLNGKWLCPSQWMEHVHEAVELAEWYAVEEPTEVVAAGLIVLIVSISTALFCVVLHRRQMRAQLRRIELELEAAREKRKEEAVKNSGEGEGMALRDSIGREISEEGQDGPPSPPRSGGDVPLAAAAELPPPAEVMEQVAVQPTWSAASPPDALHLATPPSAPRDLGVQGAAAKPPSCPRHLAVKGAGMAASIDGLESGHGPDRNPGSNAARAMAVLRNKRI